MTRKFVIPALFIVSILAVGTVGITKVYAQDAGTYPPVVQKLAERFNLKEEEVVQVFEEVRDEQRAERYAIWADKLDELVARGELSEEQKEALIEKHAEFEEKMDNLRNLTLEERREEMEKLHEEMRIWADENDIDLPMFGLRKGFKNGFMKGYHMGAN